MRTACRFDWGWGRASVAFTEHDGGLAGLGGQRIGCNSARPSRRCSSGLGRSRRRRPVRCARARQVRSPSDRPAEWVASAISANRTVRSLEPGMRVSEAPPEAPGIQPGHHGVKTKSPGVIPGGRAFDTWAGAVPSCRRRPASTTLLKQATKSGMARLCPP